MPEWVRNISDKPIPEPHEFSPEEKRLLFDLQRRKHLEAWDDKYKRMPLSSEEREILDLMEGLIFHGTLVTFRGVELRFAPGQIYEVPDGTATAIAATNPEKLRVLTWVDVRDRNIDAIRLRFETAAENRELMLKVAGDGDKSLHRGPVTVEIEDGLMRMGDGAWQPLPRA